MSSIPLPAPLYRRPVLRVVSVDEQPVRMFRRRPRTIRSLREGVLCDPQYSRYRII